MPAGAFTMWHFNPITKTQHGIPDRHSAEFHNEKKSGNGTARRKL
jgi:hypothetical protein